MVLISEDLLIDDEIVDIFENEWIKDSTETLDSITYNVYQGVGDSSLVKLMIQEEIVTEL